jgi:hypothetical protein
MVANLVDVTPLPETSDRGPALAAVSGLVFLAWKGVGNNRVNVGIVDAGKVVKHPSQQRTSDQPALVSSPGLPGLYIAWKGNGNDNLNGAEVVWATDPAGATTVQGLKDPDVLSETSDAGPALGGDFLNLLLAWRGSGNEQLNVADVRTSVVSAPGWDLSTQTLPDTSDTRPAVTMHMGVTFMAFKGAGNTTLNLLASPPVGPPESLPIADPTATVVLSEYSSHAPALAVHDDHVYIAWKGAENPLLNVARVGARMGPPDSPSIVFTALEQKQTFTNAATDDAPALVSTGRTLLIAWKGDGNDQLNIATVP